VLVHTHTLKATISWFKYIGHYISRGDWPPNSPDLSPIENVWSIMAAELFMLADSHRHWRHSYIVFGNLGDQFLWSLCKISSVQCLTDWRQSLETKETLFCTNVEPTHCLEVMLSLRYFAIFRCCNIIEYYNCCWAAICIIFSSNDFIDHHTYRTM